MSAKKSKKPAAGGFCGGCQAPVRSTLRKCPQCGWILHGTAAEVLKRDDVTPRQRMLIELELQAVAQTGPRLPGEPAEQYRARCMATLRELVAQVAGTFDLLSDDE